MSLEAENNSNTQIILLHPTSIAEMRNSEHEKFIIKYSLLACPPCNAMEKWLNTFKPHTNIPIYSIKDTPEQKALLQQMTAIHGIKKVPRLVVTDKSLQIKDSVIDFKQAEIEEFFKKNFP